MSRSQAEVWHYWKIDRSTLLWMFINESVFYWQAATVSNREKQNINNAYLQTVPMRRKKEKIMKTHHVSFERSVSESAVGRSLPGGLTNFGLFLKFIFSTSEFILNFVYLHSCSLQWLHVVTSRRYIHYKRANAFSSTMFSVSCSTSRAKRLNKWRFSPSHAPQSMGI